MRDGGRVNVLKSSMASSQEMIEGRLAGIDGKLLYHWGKSEEKGKKMSEPHVCYEEDLFRHSKKLIVKSIK